jgi:hypothetical protein
MQYIEVVMNPRNRNFVIPLVSLADVNYNHKSALASLRTTISRSTILPARFPDASIDHSDVIHCAQGPHHSKEENLDSAQLFCESELQQKPRPDKLLTHSTSDIPQ